MTEERGITTKSTDIERVLIGGDLSTLSPDQRLHYYKMVTDSVGLNYLTKPFEYIKLNGKLVLYATRNATDQLRKINGVSITSLEKTTIGDLYVVTANATDKHGRSDASTGAVALSGLRGDALANALMKAETKAKRRVTLSLCGLGMLDESEIETVPEAQPTVVNIETGELQLSAPKLKTADEVAQPTPSPAPTNGNGHYSKCPKCRKDTLMKSLYDDGYYCNKKRGGCGAKLTAEDLRDGDPSDEQPPIEAYDDVF